MNGGDGIDGGDGDDACGDGGMVDHDNFFMDHPTLIAEFLLL